MMRHLTPAAATIADTLVSLGGADPIEVAFALHDAQCLRCSLDADEYPCDGIPTIEQHVLAEAFCSGLLLIAMQAEPRVA